MEACARDPLVWVSALFSRPVVDRRCSCQSSLAEYSTGVDSRFSMDGCLRLCHCALLTCISVSVQSPSTHLVGSQLDT